MTKLPVILVALTSCLVSACATHTETYVLVPGRDGSSPPIVIATHAGSALTLDRPYAAAVGGKTSLEAVNLDKESIHKEFREVLDAQPQAPRTFQLYFIESDELTSESKAELEKVFAEIAARQAADVVVVGHTDRIGKLEDNDALSKRRAEKIRLELIARGLAADNISAAGRGEREPVVPTADEVREPRNRRVEITVR
jgi:hypothetical protein